MGLVAIRAIRAIRYDAAEAAETEATATGCSYPVPIAVPRLMFDLRVQ